jgi:hypothetical protein
VSNTVVTQLTGTANYNEGTVYDVVDRTITTTGGKVLLNAMLSLMFKAGVHTGYGGAPAGFATLVMNFNFYRGASLMATLGAHYVMVPQNCLYSIPLSFSWVDDPSAGTYNYRLTAEAVAAADWNGANTWSRTLAHMSATELKK